MLMRARRTDFGAGGAAALPLVLGGRGSSWPRFELGNMTSRDWRSPSPFTSSIRKANRKTCYFLEYILLLSKNKGMLFNFIIKKGHVT